MLRCFWKGPAMSFLTLTNVSKFYGDTQAVSSFNLSVEKGEFISLLGPSGCGKTTTLQMIAGFESVSGGRIEVDGRDITHAKPNTRGLGIVFQTYALFPHMTVEQNVAFGLEMRKIPAAERRDKVAQALALVHLEKHGKRYPREMSGGQRQRVALARALVIQPPVLLLDEAMSISDRVVVMEAGHVTQVDRPLSVYEHPANRFISTFVGKANLLEGSVLRHAGDQADIGAGGMTLTLEAADSGLRSGAQVLLGLRPEKIKCVAAGKGRCDGQVSQRFFLGSQWMYSIVTPLGELTVLIANDGADMLEPGQNVGIDWNDHNLRLVLANRTTAASAAEVA